MVAAVAMFAAASCTQELENNAPEAKGETVVYTASTDGADTKAVLDGTVSKWCGEELITLHDGTNAFTFYANAGETPTSTVDFEYTPGEGQPVFNATEVMAVYPSGDYTADLSDKIVSNVIIPNNQTLADNTYPATAAVAVAYSTDKATLNFKNATTLLKFKVAGDDVTYGCIAAKGDISGTFNLAYNGGEPELTATTPNQWVDFHMNDDFLSKEATYYIAVAPAALNEITMYLNGAEVKSKTFDEPYQLKRNVILDLGTITYEAPEQASTIYLMPGEWASDYAKFAAYFYSSTGNTAVMMEDSDSDGAYEADVPEGGYSKVIFCRMDSATDSFDWEKKWNQTSNLTVPKATDDKLCYVITGWGEGEGANSVGEWKTLEDATYVAPEFVAEDGFIYLQPSSDWKADNARFAAYFFNQTWADMILVEGQKDIYQCAIPDGEIDVIFCRMNPNTTANNWDNKWNQTANLKMTDGSLYVVSGWEKGSWTGNPAVAEPEPDQPEVDASAYGLVGSFQGWNAASPIEMTNSKDGWIVAENVELYKVDEFKFVKDKSWDVSYGTSSVTVIEEGQEFAVQTDNSQNMKVSKNGKYNLYFNPATLKVKVECVDEYANLTVNITIDNKANWSPLYIYLESDGEAITPAEGALVSNNVYAVSGDYIGSTLTCKLISGSRASEVMNVAITKDGATVTLEETIIKLKVQLNTDNAKKWWGNTMKIHVWETGTSFDTSWPGNTMTSEGNYTWSIIVPSELVGKTIKYLIHNGNGWQSSDSTLTISVEGNIVTGSSIGIN